MWSDVKNLIQTERTLKTREGHEKATPGYGNPQSEQETALPQREHRKWAIFVEQIRRELGWTLEETCDYTDLKIGWLKKARKGQNLRGDLREKFEIALNKEWKDKFPNKPLLNWPHWVDDATWSETNPAVSPPTAPLDQALLSDPLVGVAFADRGTMADWNFGFESAKERLTKNPDDTFLRAILVWSTLIKGEPNQIIDVVRDAARWLDCADPPNFAGNAEMDGDLWLIRKTSWEAKIAGIRRGTIEDPVFVQRVLEDTLVREALLRWLKSGGTTSPLGERIRSIASQGIPYPAMAVFKLAQDQHGRNWEIGAIKSVNTWISAAHNSGLAKLYLLWLTGRDPGAKEIPTAIEKAFAWLDHHPNTNDSLVRWGTIWLAGMSESEQFTTPIIARTTKWLESPASKGDRLVRTALLWFVGSQGNIRQVNSIVASTTGWLKSSCERNENCIRIALLFCLRRAVERGVASLMQLHTAINESRQKMSNDHLIELAVLLAECAVPDRC
jgi:hypothetical protein